MTGPTNTPAGWYPQADGQQRYWNGESWTEHVAPGVSTMPASRASSKPTRLAAPGSRRFGMAAAFGWGGLALTALVGALSSGVSGAAILAGLFALVLGVIALARGHVGWARVGNRAAGGVVIGAALALLTIGAVAAPPAAPSSTGLPLTSRGAAPTTDAAADAAAQAAAAEREAADSAAAEAAAAADKAEADAAAKATADAAAATAKAASDAAAKTARDAAAKQAKAVAAASAKAQAAAQAKAVPRQRLQPRQRQKQQRRRRRGQLHPHRLPRQPPRPTTTALTCMPTTRAVWRCPVRSITAPVAATPITRLSTVGRFTRRTQAATATATGSPAKRDSKLRPVIILLGQGNDRPRAWRPQ